MDINELIDMEEDYQAQLFNEGKISEEQYNRKIDRLEEMRD